VGGCARLNGSGYGPPLGFCEHGTEALVFKKRGEFPIYFSGFSFSAVEVGKNGEDNHTTKYRTIDLPSLAAQPLCPLELVY
jgi:hypothetical protein